MGPSAPVCSKPRLFWNAFIASTVHVSMNPEIEQLLNGVVLASEPSVVVAVVVAGG